MTFQTAIWGIIDKDEFAQYREDGDLCVATAITEWVLKDVAPTLPPNGYVIDICDPEVMIPLIMISDSATEFIQNQVMLVEMPLKEMEGMIVPNPNYVPPEEEQEDFTAFAPPLQPSDEPEATEPPALPTVSQVSGDPHFKTWTGEKFDYHGECDLVLIDHPEFDNGLGLRLHVRTTRVSYYSFMEEIALQIGDDVLQFTNDVEKFHVNGEEVAPQQKYVKTKLGPYTVHRYKRAISVKFDQQKGAKIDFKTRSVGFPTVVVDGGETDVFKGSYGLLGDYNSGKKLARDGMTELDDPTEFALEWQVRDTEPMLFLESRFPQFPTQCIPPAKMMGNRLGRSHMEKVAEEACKNWKEDERDDCIFDVIATRNIAVAADGDVAVVG
jgi:hypothetical protein